MNRMQLKRILRESVRTVLVENMNYLIAQAEEFIEYDGPDYDTMEEFCAEMEGEGYSPDDCEAAWEQACSNLGV
mgnify:CR=1 FL=1